MLHCRHLPRSMEHTIKESMMKDNQVSIMFTNEEYELLMKEAGRRQVLTGKKTFLTSIVREQLEPYFISLRNGDTRPIPPEGMLLKEGEQPTKQDIEQTPKDRHNMDFSDLDLG